MKIAFECPVCHSCNYSKNFGFVNPFIAHKVLDYPVSNITYFGAEFAPTLFTNSIRCNDCEFIFSQVRYDDEEMGRIYKDYRSEAYNQLRDIYEPGYAATAASTGTHSTEIANRKLALQDFLHGLVDVGTIDSVLDFGGDRGQNIPEFLGASRKYVYDVSGAGTAEGVQRVHDVRTVGKVDFVMNAHVLEHIPYPSSVIDQMKPLFHKDSLLFVDVPSELTEHNPYPNHFHEHINFFNKSSIQALLRANGFEVLKVEDRLLDFGWATSASIYVLARPLWFK
jgi:hypothetical protein